MEKSDGIENAKTDANDSISSKRLFAFDVGTATVGTAIDYGIGWGIASGVFGATMTTGLAIILGATAIGCIAVCTTGMLLVQGGSLAGQR